MPHPTTNQRRVRRLFRPSPAMPRRKTPSRPKNPRSSAPAIRTDQLAVVQVIQSTWSKEHRGGAGAVLRNAVPEAELLPPPGVSIAAPSFLVYLSSHRFPTSRWGTVSGSSSSSLKILPTHEVVTYGGVSIRLRDQALHADYAWTWSRGMPERYPRRNILTLRHGEWGRVCLNERHIYNDSGEWGYEKWVLNIGLFQELDPRVFLDTEPVRVVSMMEHLF